MKWIVRMLVVMLVVGLCVGVWYRYDEPEDDTQMIMDDIDAVLE